MALLDVLTLNPTSKQLEVPNTLDEYNCPKPLNVQSVKFPGGSVLTKAPIIGYHGAAGKPVGSPALIQNVWTAFSLAFSLYDTDAIYNAATPTRLTVPVGYTTIRLFANVRLNTTLDNQLRTVHVRKNGTTILFQRYKLGGYTEYDLATSKLDVVAGDYFEVFGFSPVTSDTFDSVNSSFEMRLIS